MQLALRVVQNVWRGEISVGRVDPGKSRAVSGPLGAMTIGAVRLEQLLTNCKGIIRRPNRVLSRRCLTAESQTAQAEHDKHGPKRRDTPATGPT